MKVFLAVLVVPGLLSMAFILVTLALLAVDGHPWGFAAAVAGGLIGMLPGIIWGRMGGTRV